MYSLDLLGTVALEGPSGPVIGKAAQRRQLALLAVLAAAGQAGRSRDKLQALLWSGSTTGSARHSLADAVYRLRKSLGEECIRGEGESLSLNPLIVRTDVGVYQGFLEHGALESAVATYRGPFMDGFHLRTSREFEEWRDGEARRLAKLYQDALQSLAAASEAEGNPRRAAGFWERLSIEDPFNTRFTMGWMRALAADGDPGNAIHLAIDHSRLLREELGAEAPVELNRLLESLKSGPFTTDQATVSEPRKTFSAFPFERDVRGPVPTPNPPFVGREQEVRRLRGLLDRVVGGEGSVIFITGEAGTGKTALAAEFCRTVAKTHPEVVVASGNGNAHIGPGDPYLPFREVLALLTGDVEARFLSGSISRHQATRLWNLIPVSAMALRKVGPALIDTFLNRDRFQARMSEFARYTGDAAPDLGTPAGDGHTPTGGTAQQVLVQQYVRTLQAVARVHPVLLVLDDLQWADSGSIGLLFQLSREILGSRILVVGLVRPSDVALGRDGARHPLEPVMNELRGAFGGIELQLGEEGDRALLDAMVDAEPNALGQGFRDELFQQTRGHALFTVELLRCMREARMLVKDGAGRWIEGPGIRWDGLPDRIDAVIGERIARLPSALQQILATASVEGEAFTLEAAARVQGVDAQDLIETVSSELERRHRLVVAQGVRRLGGKRLSVYRFRHNLFQRFLYDQLDEVEKAHAHEQVGMALEALHGDHVEEIALELARHLKAAGRPHEAAKYTLSAGKRALLGGAVREALLHLEDSVRLLRSPPASPERDAQELETQLALGNARHMAADPGQEEAFRRALELAEGLGDPFRLGRAIHGLYLGAFHSGDQREAARLATWCLAVAEESGDLGLLAYAHECAGRCAYMRGEYRDVEHHYQALLSVYDPAGTTDPLFYGGLELGSTSGAMIALAKGTTGYPVRASEGMEDALALARQRGSKPSEVFILWWDVLLRMQLRDPELALERIHSIRGVAAEVGMEAYWEPFLDIGEGWCHSQMGEGGEWLGAAEAALDRLVQAELWLGLVPFAAFLAQCLTLEGRVDAALALLARVRATSAAVDELWLEPDILHTRGEALLAAPDPDLVEAERTFREAIDLAQVQEAKWIELRATASLARVLHATGRTAEGRDMLRNIYDWFTEGFDTPDMKDAEALLGQLG